MAMNPMQKKARTSFILGVFITILITGAVIVFLLLHTNDLNKEISTMKSNLVKVYVLNQDVKSGEEITEDMFEMKSVDKNTIPSNATATLDVIDSWYMQTEASGSESKIRVYKEDITDNYYIKLIQNGKESKQYVELNSVPVVAKLDMKKNTIMTPVLVEQTDNVITDDVRIQEYNVVVLPIDLADGDYIDIRLMTPNGQDFIVISKKIVEIPVNADGTYAEDTVRIALREDEILTMSSAIVEAAGIEGAKLYATKYKEAGMQNAAVPTYRPNDAVTTLMGIDSNGNVSNPNIVSQALEELRRRYTNPAVTARKSYLESLINEDIDSYNSNVKSGIDESITNAQDARKKYLESLEQ